VSEKQTEAREQYFSDLKLQFDEMRVAYDRDLTQAREEKNDAERKRMQAEAERYPGKWSRAPKSPILLLGSWWLESGRERRARARQRG